MTPVESGRAVAFDRLTALGVPRLGVTSVGDVAKTAAPVPVSSVMAARRLAEDAVPRNVATFVPRPSMPVEIGSPVPNVSVIALGVPRFALSKVGESLKTSTPVPVSFVTAAARLALDAAPRKAATLGPKPSMPVDTGKPIAFTRLTALGVPKFGVVSVGEVANTSPPDPVSPVTAAARLPDEGVVRNVAIPVPGVIGVPKSPLPLDVRMSLLTPFGVAPPPPPGGVAHVPSPRQKVDDDAAVPLFRRLTARFPVVLLIGRFAPFCRLMALGVPRFGVTRVGDMLKTAWPVPVSSVIAPARLALDGILRRVETPSPRPATPVLMGSPVAFVSTPDDGVPRPPLSGTAPIAAAYPEHNLVSVPGP